MEKTVKKLLVLVLALVFALQPVSMVQASDKSNIKNVLKYYKEGQISKAKKYNKKLSKKASTSCIKKLSKKEKAAYLKAVKKYKFGSYSSMDSLWGYYLVDLDGDKKAELLVQHGTCEADVMTTVYKYEKGVARSVDSFYSGHTSYYDYPGYAGVIVVMGHMGYEAVNTVALKNGRLKTTNYGGRDLTKSGEPDWFPFRQQLSNHIKYDSNYKASLILNDLK